MINMRAHLAYLRYVVRHKLFVLQEGLRLGVPLWQLIVHDWHNFLPSEWLPYVHTFYAPDGTPQYKPGPAFEVAWNLHQKRGRHHWQHWLLTWDRGETVALEMPDRYRREMLADWRGAGRAIMGPASDTRAWYLENHEAIQLHPHTRAWVDHQLGVPNQLVDDILAVRQYMKEFAQ